MPSVLFTRLLPIFALLFVATAIADDRDARQRQAELDTACEEARERRLAPERERYIEECVAKGQKADRAACAKFYSDYGAKSGGRAPLYYHLPECVEAFEFLKRK